MGFSLKKVFNTELAPTDDMSFKQASIQLLSLALPIMGSSFLQLAYNTADIFWVGKLGAQEVAAVGTAGFYMRLAWALTTIISIGAGIKFSQSIGAKDFSKARQILKTGWSGIMGLILIICSVTWFFNADLIAFYDLADLRVIAMSENYLFLISFGFLFSFQNFFFTVIFNSYGKSKLSLKANSIGIIINIVLDPILIFYFDMGVAGAAYATIFSQMVTSLYYYKLIKSDPLISPKNMGFSNTILKDILKISSPIAAQRILFTVIAIIMGKIVARWGVEGIAAQRIGFQVESLSFLMVMGIHQSVSTFTGNSFGAKQFKAILNGYRAGLSLGLAYSFIITIVLLVFPESLIRIFVDDPATVEAGRYYLIIIGISALFSCLEMVTAGVFNGLGKTKFPAFNSIILTSLRIPLALWLSSTSLELNGVWLSISISSILKGIVLVTIYQLYLKKYILNLFENQKL
ncbi:MAG: MATE family efflux transporter [Flavobacteriaceae bacterium]